MPTTAAPVVAAPPGATHLLEFRGPIKTPNWAVRATVPSGLSCLGYSGTPGGVVGREKTPDSEQFRQKLYRLFLKCTKNCQKKRGEIRGLS